MTAPIEGPPSGPVEWTVYGPTSPASPRTVELWITPFVTVLAQTAWQAHVLACPQLPGCPSFGQCRVWRDGGGK
jgi:hypothetical protein